MRAAVVFIGAVGHNTASSIPQSRRRTHDQTLTEPMCSVETCRLLVPLILIPVITFIFYQGFAADQDNEDFFDTCEFPSMHCVSRSHPGPSRCTRHEAHRKSLVLAHLLCGRACLPTPRPFPCAKRCIPMRSKLRAANLLYRKRPVCLCFDCVSIVFWMCTCTRTVTLVFLERAHCFSVFAIAFTRFSHILSYSDDQRRK